MQAAEKVFSAHVWSSVRTARLAAIGRGWNPLVRQPNLNMVGPARPAKPLAALLRVAETHARPIFRQ
jgi:hypothetical protein